MPPQETSDSPVFATLSFSTHETYACLRVELSSERPGGDSCAFYLRQLNGAVPDGWYVRSPIGHNFMPVATGNVPPVYVEAARACLDRAAEAWGPLTSPDLLSP